MGKTGSSVLILKTKYVEFAKHVADIFDFSGLELRGKSVLLKPNLLFYTEPEQGLNTHPAVIEAVIAECERRGAGKIFLGDNAGQIMYGNSRSAFYDSVGMGESFGKYYVNMGLDLEPHYFEFLDLTLYLPRILKRVDVVINIPKFKTHGLTGISGAIKNTFGYVPGGQKARMHVMAGDYEPFSRVLAEVHKIRKPDLNIVDGILGMQGRGPFSKTLRYIGQIFASTDPVALDGTICRTVGFRPEEIYHVDIAQKINLGSYTDTEVIGELKALDDYVMPPHFEKPLELNGKGTFLGDSIRIDASRIFMGVDGDKCTRCGKCVSECPAGVLAMDDRPVSTGRPCCGCHACQEACETKALVLQPTLELPAR